MSEIIVHEGKKYRKVDRWVTKGDRVLIVNPSAAIDYGYGDVFEVEKVDKYGTIRFTDKANEENCAAKEEYVALEPVSDLASLESELAATREKLAEMERQLAEAKRAEAKANRLKVGDYAKVVPGGVWHPLKVGDIVEIFQDEKDHQPYRARRLSDGETGWFEEKQLIRATDEEIAEAKRKAEESAKWAAIGRKPGEFKVGDIVRLTQAPGGHLRKGDIAVLNCVDGNHITFGGGYGGYTSWIELVAPVESRVDAV